MRDRTIVALPVGVKPRRTCPLCIHSKCSDSAGFSGETEGRSRRFPDREQTGFRLAQITVRAGQAEVFQRIWTIGVNVLDVHGLPHHALCRLTILTPVLGALMHPTHRLRPGQLTHWWVSAYRD